nr:DUF2232 domain-containing protein [Paenibacillus sp. NEAU-GSW1]
MKSGLKSVLWSAAALLLTLSLAVPGLNLLAVLPMMVPYVVLYTMLSPRSFLLHLIPVWAVAAILVGPSVLIVAVFFLVPSLVLGHFYRKKAAAGMALRRTFVTLLALLLLQLIAFEYVIGFSMIDQMSSVVRDTYAGLERQKLLPADWNADYTELVIRLMIQSIPMAFIFVAFFYTVITHFLARRLLRASGVEAPGLPMAKDWMLPRVLFVYYLIAYVVNLVVPNDSSSFLAVALMNLMPLMRYAFAIQAIGFFFFIAHERGWHKVFPILIAIPVLLFPPLSLIGVIDVALPIRKAFKKS